MDKTIRNSLFIIVGLIFIMIILTFIDKEDNHIPNTPHEKTETDINSKLPYTAKVYEGDTKPETIGYRIWFDFMNTLENDGAIADASFTRFTKLAGDDDEFTVAVVFHVQLREGFQDEIYDWGEVQDNRMVRDIVWKLTIEKVEHLTYTLTNIEKSTDPSIGLPPVENLEEYQKEAGVEGTTNQIRYQIEDDTLTVTYDNGEHWQVVPVAVDDLFEGEYNGRGDQLIEGSYVMTLEKTAFVLGGNGELRLLLSTNQGESWNEVVVSNQLPVVRMRLVGFTSEQDGYLIVTGDRTMRSEGNIVFKTNDGGQTWENVGSVEDTYSLVTDGGFVTDQLGFISFGEYRFEDQPPVPHLFRTIDGGVSWERIDIPIPEEYRGYFTIAEVPTFKEKEGTLLVNQGPEGDYLGGKVLAKYTSLSQGETWSFEGLVDPDEVLGVGN